MLDLSAWPDAPPAMDAVQALVDKSLLRTWVPAEQGRYDIEEPYFGMYVSIHEYAAEKLKASGPGAQNGRPRSATDGTSRASGRRRRSRRSSGTAESGGAARSRSSSTTSSPPAAGPWAGATARPAVAAYRAAWEVLELQGPFALGAALGAQVLALDGIAASLRAAALLTQALASWRAGRMEEAGTWLEQALALSREMRDRRREGSVLSQLGQPAPRAGPDGGGAGTLRGRPRHPPRGGRPPRRGHRPRQPGHPAREQGRMEGAAHYEAALAIAREVGNRRAEGSVLGNLGVLHSEQGRMEEARAHYEQALSPFIREVGNRARGHRPRQPGHLYHEQGQVEEARAHYEPALAIAPRGG